MSAALSTSCREFDTCGAPSQPQTKCSSGFHRPGTVQAWREARQKERERRDEEYAAIRAERDAERKQRAKELAGDPFNKEVLQLLLHLVRSLPHEPGEWGKKHSSE